MRCSSHVVCTVKELLRFSLEFHAEHHKHPIPEHMFLLIRRLEDAKMSKYSTKFDSTKYPSATNTNKLA